MVRPRDASIVERLVDALRSLLLEQPFADISMTAIAARAGVGKRALADPALDRIVPLWQRAVQRGDVDASIDGRAALNDLAGAVIFEVMVCHGAGDD